MRKARSTHWDQHANSLVVSRSRIASCKVVSLSWRQWSIRAWSSDSSSVLTRPWQSRWGTLTAAGDRKVRTGKGGAVSTVTDTGACTSKSSKEPTT
eukprot:11801706-Alexandrium_andersonii.AAC.1